MNKKIVFALMLPTAAVIGFYAGPRTFQPTPAPAAKTLARVAPAAANLAAAPAPSIEPAPVAVVSVEDAEIHQAMEQGIAKAEIKGNGRDKLRASITNTGRATLRVTVPIGQVFESERNAVVAVRPATIEVAPGKSAEMLVQTAATRSMNRVGEANYKPTYQSVPKIDLFLTYVQEHREFTPAAIQTAVLALTENLPVSAVAKFTPASGGEMKSKFNTDAFRVETFDILQALSALREIHVNDRDLALTIDPQLRIESMIEPLSRATAMRYYKITGEAEWEFWKNELLNGDPSTRHYALYGIARFYPEIALEMLPKWAREPKTNPVYRLAAVQALADTQRAEALPLLQQLATELGDNELGKAARGAATFLDQRLTQMSSTRNAVAFRVSKTVADF